MNVKTNRHEITLHSFRRYVYSAISGLGFQDFGDYMLGHSGSTYWRKTPEERLKIFKKVEPYLTYLSYEELDAHGADVDTKLEEKDQRISQLEKQMAEMNKSLMQLKEQGMFDALRRLESELQADPSNEEIKIKLEQHKKVARELIRKGAMSNDLEAYGEVKALATDIETIPKVKATDM
jgi:hypothetical protein